MHRRAAVTIELRIVALELFAIAASSLFACASVSPGLSRALTLSSRSSRSSKKFFCGLVENTRAIASGM